MRGSVPSIQRIDTTGYEQVAFRNSTPYRINIVTAAGSELEVMLPPNGDFLLKPVAGDIADITVTSDEVRERFRVVGSEEEE
jgi:hypothetical protein